MFSLEEELRYARRLEEGFDLFDPKYNAWLKRHHGEQSHPRPSAVISPSQPAVVTPLSPSSQPSVRTSPSSQTSAVTPPSQPGVVTTTITPRRPPSNTKRSPLSDLLNLPVQSAPKPRTGHARVLTSNECLSILKEKEEKKQREAEEKEKRKEERLLKRRQKEEQQKHKDDERARKAEEREEKRKRMEEDKVRKAAEREAKKKGKQAAGHCKRAVSKTKKCDLQQDDDGRPARKKLRFDVDSTVYTDLCCVCFGSFDEDEGTGREWLKCSCERWIHEDCVIPHSSSSDKLCPLC